MEEAIRKAGILLPVTALPSPYGIGCLSREAYRFVDALLACGQSYWQILPLNPTSFGDSPYQSFSAFAGNPYLIDLDGLIEDGLLSRSECDDALGGATGRVDYGLQYRKRLPLLRLAAGRFDGWQNEEYRAFLDKNAEWLEDYALFMAIKDSLGGRSLSEWETPLRMREEAALDERREALAGEIDAYRFLQFRFFKEWQALRSYANQRGIRIIGDLPIYVSCDSADVWANPELFLLDEAGAPIRVAGCPPDGFTPDGQLWGNPLYRWDAHRREDYAWWISRLRQAFETYDAVRIDHFRGFDSYYSIPAGARTAREGRWERGIGDEMFRVAEEVLGRKEILAEDLGYVTDSVRALLASCGFPGMKILQFGFGGGEGDFSSEDLPHRYPSHCVAYTGTHDNATLREWLAGASDTEKRKIREYLWSDSSDEKLLAEQLIACLLRSPASLCVIPMQDYLGLGGEARVNIPSTGEGNWQWRMEGDAFDGHVKETIRKLCRISGRFQQINS